MVSKTLQELSDFFGCYFFVQPDGMVFMSKKAPIMFTDGNGECLRWTYGAVHEVNAFDCNGIHISDADVHDWKEVITPRITISNYMVETVRKTRFGADRKIRRNNGTKKVISNCLIELNNYLMEEEENEDRNHV